MSLHKTAQSRSKSIVVLSPADLPEFAQRKSEAMYLHETGSGAVVLYLEQDNGQTLAILEVTDPAEIRALGRASVEARSAYDFVQAIDDSAALIRYRDESGFGVVSFAKYKQPTLTAAPGLRGLAGTELLAPRVLLVESANSSAPLAVAKLYQIVEFSNASEPIVLATVEGVTQRLERRTTGTLFLLSDNGLTVIRRPDIEQEHHIQESQKNQN